MMKKYFCTLIGSILTLLSSPTLVQSQTIFFKGETIVLKNNINSIKLNELLLEKSFAQYGFACLIFDEIPTIKEQHLMESIAIEIKGYIGNKTYIASVPINSNITILKEIGVLGILPLNYRFILSENLKNRDIQSHAWYMDKLILNFDYFDCESSDVIKEQLLTIKDLEIVKEYKKANRFVIHTTMASLDTLASLPLAYQIEQIQSPPSPESILGKALHRSNSLDTQSINNINYTGENIGVLIRDDGAVGPHVDFKGRINNEMLVYGENHGDGVTGILAGAGNIDPLKRGMAAGATIYTNIYDGTFLDDSTLDLISSNEVQITNSSFGDGCNNGYTSATNTVDNQMYLIPSLLHVFSAGNSNNQDCGYGAGNQWGNITGGHKQGKNVLTVANVTIEETLDGSSSRGPAYDGRIKPDIAAHGTNHDSTNENNSYYTFGGTSGASPGVAGLSAQLYELYKVHNNSLPNAALIKASILNTANDLGNKGPDFKYGWGVINGNRAADLIKNNQFIKGSITNNQTNTHNISIPTNATEVRIMVYWTDPPTVAGVSKALVNDIDIKTTLNNNTEIYPWILDATPDSNLLNTPATTGVDHINNMEQIYIANPSQENYAIEVTGHEIAMGEQAYYLVYDYVISPIEITYPGKDSKLVSGENSFIRWDDFTNDTLTNYELYFSTDNGENWQTIGSSTRKGNMLWSVPTINSDNCLIRIETDSQSYYSEKFTVSALVNDLIITQICPNEISLSWTPMPSANHYNIYKLEEKYMEIIGTTSNYFIQLPITNTSDLNWYAISASGESFDESRRSIAIQNEYGLLNCSLQYDIGIEVNELSSQLLNYSCGNTPIDIGLTLYNNGMEEAQITSLSYQINEEEIITENYMETIENGAFIYFNFDTNATFNNQGWNRIQLWVTTENDDYPENNYIDFDFNIQTESTSVPYEQSFETVEIVPNNWEVINPDNSVSWTNTSIDNSKKIFLNHYAYSNRFEEDSFITENYDLTSFPNATLDFELAKAQYSTNYSDGLKIEISTDCGSSYDIIYEKTGLDLSTIDGYASYNWSPESQSDWRIESIDLSSYVDQNVKFKFTSINGYGNNTFIDNLSISNAILNIDVFTITDTISIYPNPFSKELYIKSDAILEHIYIYNITGKLVYEEKIIGTSNYELNSSFLANGIYFIDVHDKGKRKILKALKM